MKFSSTDKRSEPVSLIRNKIYIYIYIIGKNKCIVKKIECWPVFKQDPHGPCLDGPKGFARDWGRNLLGMGLD